MDISNDLKPSCPEPISPEDQKAEESILKFKDRITMWEKDHKPHQLPPMLRTPDGSYIWLNRATRRQR